MKLKNVSARLIGVSGKLYAPLQEFELTSAVDIASVKSWVDSGDFIEIIEAVDEDKPKRGRKPAQAEDE